MVFDLLMILTINNPVEKRESNLHIPYQDSDVLNDSQFDNTLLKNMLHLLVVIIVSALLKSNNRKNSTSEQK